MREPCSLPLSSALSPSGELPDRLTPSPRASELVAIPSPVSAEDTWLEEALDIGIGDDILVVDDHPANLIAVEAALEPLGRTLVFAGSGEEALAKLLEQDFALILLDVAMPGITGIETARLIRSRERSRGTPIIFVTGMAWQDDAVDEAYEVGGFDFLIKPVRPEVLRAKARVFLKLQERTRALRRHANELRTSQRQLHDHELIEQRNRFESTLLETKVQQLAEGERRQHELAGIIGNELLNPLQTLQMAFDLLRAHPHADKGERIYALVEHRLVHVTRLVKILIDIAQVASGQLALAPATVNLLDIVRQALDDCRPILDAHKLTVRFDAELAQPPMVIGDPVRLLQAITTLIDHAARSAADTGELVVTSSVTAGEVLVCIVDTGRGIAPDLLPKLFDVFVGDHRAASAGAGALSLGLPLVKRLLELHDGSIRVASGGAGKGSTFELRLPLAPQDVELSSLDAVSSSTMRITAVNPAVELMSNALTDPALEIIRDPPDPA
ncbi:MAG TPA: response regulator [Kofleriaceae bacterium]|nr:response regulator [Kofleriaceae bacterium]